MVIQKVKLMKKNEGAFFMEVYANEEMIYTTHEKDSESTKIVYYDRTFDITKVQAEVLQFRVLRKED